VLLGEGSFHQFHGGVATNVEMENHPIHEFMQEYKNIYGKPYEPFDQPDSRKVTYLGTLPQGSNRFIGDDN